ncbi:hypothetical protein MUGA111182_05895 [Mucilaginibacter galii]|uniref:Uncharacterized protein n=1 Tax=Mucilaginibacter galii TaxID=2005073 RepID=A0A917J8D2_9SPHI|nr:hypothetical protein [Mucilaginibacter galii]GGI49992.1 hypothetical protein GCM10011425_12040 [Mucilaginibacter galii]
MENYVASLVNLEQSQTAAKSAPVNRSKGEQLSPEQMKELSFREHALMTIAEAMIMIRQGTEPEAVQKRHMLKINSLYNRYMLSLIMFGSLPGVVKLMHMIISSTPTCT